MPRVARSASEDFAILEGACRGHVARRTVSAIAAQVDVSRATVRARIRQFVDDGRPLDAFLDAFRPPDGIDHKLERKRQKARERQRAWQSRKNGTAPVPTAFQSMGRPRVGLSDYENKFLECIGPLQNEGVRAHFARLMRQPPAPTTSGSPVAWTTAAVIGRWPPLTRWQLETFTTTGLTMLDVVPTVLIEWGWFQDSDGVWVNPDAASRHAVDASEDDDFWL